MNLLNSVCVCFSCAKRNLSFSLRGLTLVIFYLCFFVLTSHGKNLLPELLSTDTAKMTVYEAAGQTFVPKLILYKQSVPNSEGAILLGETNFKAELSYFSGPDETFYLTLFNGKTVTLTDYWLLKYDKGRLSLLRFEKQYNPAWAKEFAAVALNEQYKTFKVLCNKEKDGPYVFLDFSYEKNTYEAWYMTAYGKTVLLDVRNIPEGDGNGENYVCDEKNQYFYYNTLALDGWEKGQKAGLAAINLKTQSRTLFAASRHEREAVSLPIATPDGKYLFFVKKYSDDTDAYTKLFIIPKLQQPADKQPVRQEKDKNQ